MADERMERLEAAAAVLKRLVPELPRVAVVLGSGFSEAFSGLPGGREIPWREIPGFPLPTVAGHAGDFLAGRIEGKPVLIQRGRVHSYEGRSPDEVVFSTRLFALLGVKVLIATNASGAIRAGLHAGDLVLLTDHINLLGMNPLRGPNLDRLGPRFSDMSQAYSPRLRAIAVEAAKEERIDLEQGVYLATFGPSFETPAEIRAFRALGADVVGMSTVPEVIVARHAGIEVLAISCATNLAAGVDPTATLTHQDVLDTLRRRAEDVRRLLVGVIRRLP